MDLLIKQMDVKIGENNILSKIDLNLKKGDVLGVVGTNGAGKSTLLKAIMNHYATVVSNGEIIFDGQNITELSTTDIAKSGIFYAAQNPIELDGVQMVEFLKLVANARGEKKSLYDLFKTVSNASNELELSEDLLRRNVNVGFSGGQKKKSEILQAKLFDYKMILLDEIDSGLDLDAMKTIINFIEQNRKQTITILISHQTEFIQAIKPNKMIVLVDGRIVDSGDISILSKIEKNGFRNYPRANKDFINEDVYKSHGK